MAIGVAGQETGSRALKIGYEKVNGAYVYQIKTFKDEMISEIVIDPTTGKVIKQNLKG